MRDDNYKLNIKLISIQLYKYSFIKIEFKLKMKMEKDHFFLNKKIKK